MSIYVDCSLEIMIGFFMTKGIKTSIFFAAFVLAILVGYLIKDAYAVTCFKKGEYSSGFNKICIYNCLGSDRAITIKNIELCPLTING